MVKYLMGVCAVFASLGLAACGSSQDGTVAKATQAPAGQSAPAATGAPAPAEGAPSDDAPAPQQAQEDDLTSLSIYTKASDDVMAQYVAEADRVWQRFAQSPPVDPAGTPFDGINLTDLHQGARVEIPLFTTDNYGGRFGKCLGLLSVTVYHKQDPMFEVGKPYFTVDLSGPIMLTNERRLQTNGARPSIAEANAFLAANHAPCFD